MRKYVVTYIERKDFEWEYPDPKTCLPPYVVGVRDVEPTERKVVVMASNKRAAKLLFSAELAKQYMGLGYGYYWHILDDAVKNIVSVEEARDDE